MDHALNGGIIFENKEEGKPYSIVQKNFLLYEQCDNDIA